MKTVTIPISLSERGNGAAANGAGAVPPDRYLELVRDFPLRPLRDDEQYQRALAVLDRLFERAPLASSDERDYFRVLALLAWDYENRGK